VCAHQNPLSLEGCKFGFSRCLSWLKINSKSPGAKRRPEASTLGGENLALAENNQRSGIWQLKKMGCAHDWWVNFTQKTSQVNL